MSAVRIHGLLLLILALSPNACIVTPLQNCDPYEADGEVQPSL
jgi:hypothetical protein